MGGTEVSTAAGPANAPVRILPAAGLEISPPAAPTEFMRTPFAIGTAIKHESSVRIAAIEDEEEARRRYHATREGVNAGVIIVGPGGGETWHTHLSYYDTVLYVRKGKTELSWEVDGRVETAVAGEGDFVLIEPSARHQWLNVGTDDLELVWFMHFHNY